MRVSSRSILCLLLLCLCSLGCLGADEPSSDYGRIEVSTDARLLPQVIANGGQFDEAALFVLPGPGGCMVFMKDSVTIVKQEARPRTTTGDAEGSLKGDFYKLVKPSLREFLAARRQPRQIGCTETGLRVVRIGFLDTDPGVRVLGTGRQPANACWFTGSEASEWKAGIAIYKGVAYRGLWPGVDLVFSISRGKVDCVFQASRGIDLERVRLRFGMPDTAAALDVVAFIETFTCQDGKPKRADAGFISSGDSVAIDTARLDKAQPAEVRLCNDLMIGQPWEGWSLAESQRVMAERQGAKYIAGNVLLPRSGLSLDDLPKCSDLHCDSFAARVARSGSLSWMDFIGGSADELAEGVAFDQDGQTYVSGFTSSADFPTTEKAYKREHNGGQDYFTARIDPSGIRLAYSTYLGVGGGGLETTATFLRRIEEDKASSVSDNGTPKREPAKLIAIMVDDVSSEDQIEGFIGLGIPMTFAVMPHVTPTCVDYINSSGCKAFLHAPMEALGSTYRRSPEITVKLTDDQVRERLEGWLAQVPGVVGISNHRGSRATSDPETAERVGNVAAERGLLLFDSHTSPVSIAVNVWKDMGISCLQEDLFIDEARDAAGLRALDLAMADLSERTGYAAAICHVGRPVIHETLAEVIPGLKARGFKFVTIPDLYKAVYDGVSTQ